MTSFERALRKPYFTVCDCMVDSVTVSTNQRTFGNLYRYSTDRSTGEQFRYVFGFVAMMVKVEGSGWKVSRTLRTGIAEENYARFFNYHSAGLFIVTGTEPPTSVFSSSRFTLGAFPTTGDGTSSSQGNINWTAFFMPSIVSVTQPLCIGGAVAYRYTALISPLIQGYGKDFRRQLCSLLKQCRLNGFLYSNYVYA